ncbi:MAG: RNA polymerase sigma factor [Defluviitaleaceae bacterium]|nr:RNA polymerase sigma factor [Defluviitaleaceae bacterium]
MDDNMILNLYFQRDEKAICETQRKYAGYLYTVASNILHSAEDAEECVNDTYFKTWEAIPPKRPTFFKGFLAKITRNCSLDKYRINNAKKRNANQVDLLLSELAEVIPATTDVHSTYENNLVAADINKFLLNLNKETRFIFMRRYWYADSIATIASGCRASESKIKSSLLRTRRKLKGFLELT